jgi:arginine N-succinyltransferase
MFLIRRAKNEDIPTLLKLARMVHFINLPADPQLIGERVQWSRSCFLLAADEEAGTAKRVAVKAAPAPAPGKRKPTGHGASSVLSGGLAGLAGKSPLFMFVMEDLDGGGGVVGTSQIIAQMGGPGEPNVSLQLTRREMFSQSLQTGVTHTVARLHLDETGPTEVGGLILQPSLRGHKAKLGRFLAMVRFHFMGLHRPLFSSRVLAELMGPISIDGENPFWDHCTRCFINMTYAEADRFCQQSKEFLLTLFPRDDIYLTLLPPQARSVVGTVGPETAPARRMLEGLGFKYHNRVDPFDGGPHLEAAMDDLAPVKATRRVRLGDPTDTDVNGPSPAWGMVSTLDDDGEFRAVQTPVDFDRSGRLLLPRGAMTVLAAAPGVEAGFTPIDAPFTPHAAPRSVSAEPSPATARRKKPRSRPQAAGAARA